jgi:hypothetical protein
MHRFCCRIDNRCKSEISVKVLMVLFFRLKIKNYSINKLENSLMNLLINVLKVNNVTVRTVEAFHPFTWERKQICFRNIVFCVG